MAKTRAEIAAEHLLAEHQARRRFGALPQTCTPRDLDEACATQEAFIRLRADERGAVAGYKIALTTPTMQKLTGFPEPAYGLLTAGTIHPSPWRIRHAEFVRLGIECEVAMRIGADLPASEAPFTADRVAAAVDALMPAFEIIEDRNADYSKFAATVLDFIGDNAWNAGIVLGTPTTDWRSIGLENAHGRMFVNGALAAEGHGRDVLGHPLNALVWLANRLAGRGKALERGMVVMTGSLVPTTFLKPGDAVRYSLEGLGEVVCDIE